MAAKLGKNLWRQHPAAIAQKLLQASPRSAYRNKGCVRGGKLNACWLVFVTLGDNGGWYNTDGQSQWQVMPAEAVLDEVLRNRKLPRVEIPALPLRG